MWRVLIVVLSSALAFAAGGYKVKGKVLAGGRTFDAEVALSSEERAWGLMERTEKDFPADRCMFFIGAEDRYQPFWMKNCRIPLDMIWVDRDGRVVEIVEHAAPASPLLLSEAAIPTFGGRVLSRHVVEFRAGTVKALKLKARDRIGWLLKLDGGATEKGGLPIEERAAKAGPKK